MADPGNNPPASNVQPTDLIVVGQHDVSGIVDRDATVAQLAAPVAREIAVSSPTFAALIAPYVAADLGLGTIATQNANAVAITGGTVAGVTVSGGSASAALATATGGSAALSMAARFSWDINVRDFGAVGDGVTDDTAAINAAIAFLRTKQTQTGSDTFYPCRLVFNPGKYLTTDTINLTQFAALGLAIYGHGAVIFSKAANKPAVDAFGTRFLQVFGLKIWGDASQTPSIGWQQGRANSPYTQADRNLFLGVTISGYFGDCCAYFFQTEETQVNHCWFYNYGGGMGLKIDGNRHWPVTSAFVATSSMTADTEGSFLNMTFIKADIRVTNGPARWISCVQGHAYYSCYEAVNSTGPGAILYSGTSGIQGLRHHSHHAEGPGGTMSAMFQITGSQTSCIIRDFVFEDVSNQAANYLFQLVSPMTAATFRNCELAVSFLYSAVVFDNAANYTMDGIAIFNQTGRWVRPGNWVGFERINGVWTWLGNNTGYFGSQLVVNSGGAVITGTITHNGLYTNKAIGTTGITNGGTVTLNASAWHTRVNVTGGTIAGGTITLPAASSFPSATQRTAVSVTVCGVITALTVNTAGGTLVGGGPTTANNQCFTFLTDGTDWIPG